MEKDFEEKDKKEEDELFDILSTLTSIQYKWRYGSGGKNQVVIDELFSKEKAKEILDEIKNNYSIEKGAFVSKKDILDANGNLETRYRVVMDTKLAQKLTGVRIVDLPIESIGKILSFLPEKEGISKSSTSRLFRQAVKYEFTPKKIEQIKEKELNDAIKYLNSEMATTNIVFKHHVRGKNDKNDVQHLQNKDWHIVSAKKSGTDVELIYSSTFHKDEPIFTLVIPAKLLSQFAKLWRAYEEIEKEIIPDAKRYLTQRFKRLNGIADDDKNFHLGIKPADSEATFFKIEISSTKGAQDQTISLKDLKEYAFLQKRTDEESRKEEEGVKQSHQKKP